MAAHGFPDPILMAVGDQACVDDRQLGHRVRHRGQAAAVFGDAKGPPVFSEEATNLLHVGVEDLVGGEGVARPVPSLCTAAVQDGGMLARAGVVPPPRSPDLPTELNQRHVQGREHQGPFGLVEQRLGGGHVLRVTVVAGDRDGFLLPRAPLQFIDEGLDHEGLHHRAAVAKHVSAKGMDDFVTVGPSHSTVDRGF